MLVIVAEQLFCAIFFVSQILASVLGIAPICWQIYELIELGAALGLLLGVGLGWIVLRRTLARNIAVEDQLRLVSGAFLEVVEERFIQWELTPAERDVALFAIKCMSTQEIATLGNVSEGTVKPKPTRSIANQASLAARSF